MRAFYKPVLTRRTTQFQQNATYAKPIGKKNIAALEGLRAFAALGVVTLHTTYLVGHIVVNEHQYPWLSFFWVFGNTGVELFFVLSGFLLFMPYAKALLFQEKWPATRNFYMRRILRILPGYYFSLFVLVIVVQREYLRPDHWPQLFLFLTFFMDASRETFRQINVPYWSLAIEVQFYLLLPLVACGIHFLVKRVARTPHRRFMTAALACLGLILYGLTVRFIGLHQPRTAANLLLAGGRFLFFGMSGKYWEDFAVGMLVSLCFIYMQHPEHGRYLRDNTKKINLLAGPAALVLLTICALWNFRASYTVAQFNFLLPLVPYNLWLMDFFASLGWGLLIATILFGNVLLKAPFESRLMRALGTISYAIYLWHLPMLTIFKKYIFPHLHITNIALSHLSYWLFFALVIIPWCALVYWLIERPFMRLKDSRRPATDRPVVASEKNKLAASIDKTA